MKFGARRIPTERRASGRGGFTLIEVLASLLLMAIVIPVAMQAMSIATRAGVLGQRKAAAMRVADRILNEFVIATEPVPASSSGTIVEGDASHAWTMESVPWTEDAMVQLTVTVTFTVQGIECTVSASTLVDPAAAQTEELAAEVIE